MAAIFASAPGSIIIKGGGGQQQYQQRQDAVERCRAYLDMSAVAPVMALPSAMVE